MKITITKKQLEELQKCEEGEIVEVSYKGLPCYLTPNEYGNCTINGRNYEFNFYAPNQIKVEVEKDTPKTITFTGAEFEPQKMHPYDDKTTGKHPVHLIEGGAYITEDQRDFEKSGDMGWFWLNQKEYDYYKSKAHNITIKDER